MRLLLALIGATALGSVGWVCWRATAQTREWREFLALGAKARRSEAEGGRFTQLAHRLFPDQRFSWIRSLSILNGPGERRRILAVLILRDQGGREARLHVLDEDGRRLSSCKVPIGPCGIDCRTAPDRGAWAFDVEALTPRLRTPWRYVLVDDRPVLISRGDSGDEE
jgi:hypothetical protein